jgi:excisionase family DNA binding protein
MADRVPLYVRLPREQAAALDRLVSQTGQRKQQLVSDLLSDRLVVGHAEALDDDDGDVLTLQEAAAMLRVADRVALASARAGELPGRLIGEEWRFSRAALLQWLAGGGPAASGTAR